VDPLVPQEAGFDTPLPVFEIDLSRPECGRLMGLDLDYLVVRPGQRAQVLGWPGTEDLLQAAGLCYRRVSEDIGGELGRSPDRARLLPQARDGVAGGGVPPFGSGSVAGFWSYEEIAALLDSLAAHDRAGIVSEVDTVGWSLQGRPVLALGVASEAQPWGTRPEVLFTSLTHAREPQGMQTLLYFLLSLVDGYGTDPELTYLVNEREMWFVPVVNPDGYVRNETTWRETGGVGFWRKNLRDNDGNGALTSKDGVDLNRNFSFQWAYDDLGSSPDAASQTYRGRAPFSEPEARVLRDFCLAHRFRTAINYHTYFEACLYSWSYQEASSPDSARLEGLADLLTAESHYSYGRSGEVLYPVNGNASDWMYGETRTKPRILAVTIEVGNQNDGFWPPPSRILPLARLNLHANVVAALEAGLHLEAGSLEILSADGYLHPGTAAPARVPVHHRGMGERSRGGIRVRMTSLDPELEVSGGEALYPDLDPGQEALPVPGSEPVLRALPGSHPGTPVRLALEITDGAGYASRDTVELRIGLPRTIFSDRAEDGLLNWTTEGSWGIEYVDGDPVFSDSPGTRYRAGTDASLTLGHELDLSGATHAVLRFRSRWEIEGGFDFATVEASSDSGATWTPLPGRLTRPGHGESGAYLWGRQPAGVPGYDGSQRFWVPEEIDLSRYAGREEVCLRFRFASDRGVQEEGWRLDDIRVDAYGTVDPHPTVDGPTADPSPGARMLALAPNPVRNRTRIVYSLDRTTPVRLSVHDVSGRQLGVLHEGMSEAGEKTVTWDGSVRGQRLPSGTYFLFLKTPDRTTAAKVTVAR